MIDQEHIKRERDKLNEAIADGKRTLVKGEALLALGGVYPPDAIASIQAHMNHVNESIAVFESHIIALDAILALTLPFPLALKIFTDAHNIGTLWYNPLANRWVYTADSDDDWVNFGLAATTLKCTNMKTMQKGKHHIAHFDIPQDALIALGFDNE